MDAAARSMPSPAHSYTEMMKPSMSQDCFPASTAASLSTPQSARAQGLGLYSMPDAPQSTIAPTMMPSPESEPWSGASSLEPEYAPASHNDILPAAFDPFSGMPTGGYSPEGPPPLEFCATPPSSHLQSHRGSVSSYAPSDVEDAGPHAYTPRGKVEDAGEWYHSAGSEHVLQRAVSHGPPALYTGPSSAMPHTEDLYGPPEWSKGPAGTPAVGYLGDRSNSVPRFDVSGVLPSMRIKKKRQRTTPEEATHDCSVCGKLFKRSYNWKSHMETHNPDRKYPHPCTAMVGDQKCSKKFQRKTDLDRHYDSVSATAIES